MRGMFADDLKMNFSAVSRKTIDIRTKRIPRLIFSCYLISGDSVKAMFKIGTTSAAHTLPCLHVLGHYGDWHNRLKS
jgi:hypothetical protein